MRTILLLFMIYILTYGLENALATTTNNQQKQSEPILKSITVTASSYYSVAQESVRQFVATGTYDDGSTKDLTKVVNWESSDRAIAAINDAGLATALKAGITNITASAEVTSQSVKLVILQPPKVTGLSKSSFVNVVLPFQIKDYSDNFQDEPGGNFVKAKITSLPTHGVLKLGKKKVLLGQEIDAADLAQLTYEPDINYTGEDSFWWVGVDECLYSLDEAPVVINIDEGDCSSFSSSATVATSSSPKAGDTTYPYVSPFSKSGTTNTVLEFEKRDFINNFVDVPGKKLTRTKVTRLPRYGVLKLADDVVVPNQEISVNKLDDLIYIPDVGWKGTDNFLWAGIDDKCFCSTNKEPVTLKISLPSPPEPSPGFCDGDYWWACKIVLPVVGSMVAGGAVILLKVYMKKHHYCCYKRGYTSVKDREIPSI